MRLYISSLTGSICLIFFSLCMHGQSTEPAFSPAATAQFHRSADFPKCGGVAFTDGKLESGQAIVLIKLEPGCVLAWHWHTSNERIMMISGSANAEMKDMPAQSVVQGDFLLMPSRHIHQFTATTAAEFFLITQTAFDIHYVNAAGEEISAAAAMQAAGEAPGDVPGK